MATSFHSLMRYIHAALNKEIIEGKAANNYVRDLLLGESPCMIARFGSVEIQGVVNGISPFPLNQIFKHRTFHFLINNAGFFPVNRKTLSQFAIVMKDAMQQCDCLGSWRIEEVFFKNELAKAQKIKLNVLSPENAENWLSTLEGKKVLVVHPMSELIQLQYEQSRDKIWPGTKILPKYEKLLTIKAVNSIHGDCRFDSWFEALNWMKEEIDKSDFDIALLGCGSYGFPLAAYIKSIGKKAVHIGGSLQLLFGIKGKRWEGKPFINDAWISPRPEDRPKGFEKVENGCYW